MRLPRIPFVPNDEVEANALDIAVWAAEFVRVRAERRPEGWGSSPSPNSDIDIAIEHANYALEDLRTARMLREIG